MSFLLWGITAGVAITVGGVMAYAKWYKAKFKYVAFIIAQVGEGHAIVQDKFRVFKTDDGFYALEFWKQRDLEMTSPAYKYWNFFGKNEQAAEAVRKGERYTPQELEAIFTRGCIFKKTSEGDVHPVKVTEEGDLKVLSQDDRAFAVRQARIRAERKKTAWDKYAAAVVFGGTVFLSIMFLVFFVIYFNMTMAENVALVCQGAASNAQPFNPLPGVGA